MGAYDVRAVANEVLLEARRKNIAVTHLSLQKLCFFVHGIYLANHRRELVDGEFEAWKFGPVHRVLFHALQRNRDKSVEELISRVDPISGGKKGLLRVSSSEDQSFIGETASFFLSFTAGQLVELSHASGSPWHEVWEASKTSPNIGMKIPNRIVREFYERSRLSN